jgi:putative transposase
VVARSSSSPETKHKLHVVNRAKAWFRRDDITMPKSGEVIPNDVRRLARSIMRRCMARHRRPNLSRISMRLDHRAGAISRPVAADQNGRVGWWVRLSTMEKGRKIDVPLLTYDFHERRPDRVTNGVQVNLDRDGRLTFGVVKDMGAACAASRESYDGTREIALDFGLSTLFATSEGQLLGQSWLKELRRHDERITRIARGLQRRGLKPRQSRRYRDAVTALRGFLKTEIGRVLNKLVAGGRPAELVLERLDFRNPSLSRRLNRILQNAGRSIIRAKLQDFEERLGITSTEVNPVYTSQTCSCCGYVDKRNRRDRKAFRCLWCGKRMRADLNAARNIGERRARAIGSAFRGKVAVLAEPVHRFGERRVHSTRSGGRGSTADPRRSNPYFKGKDKRGSDVANARPSQDLVAA